MTFKEKFNEYIASGDITISDEQRDFILPFIERCVGEERERIGNSMLSQMENSTKIRALESISQSFRHMVIKAITQEDKK